MYPINHVPARDMSKSLTGCCAPFNPTDWDDQVFQFKDKLFVRAVTKSFLHMPINMSSVMKKVMSDIAKSNTDNTEQLMLSNDPTPWRAEHLIAVSRPVPGYDPVRLSGRYITKVFEGPFKDVGKWHAQLIEFVSEKNKTPKQIYFYYAFCPNCAKAYGKNYTVGFAEVS